MTSTEQLKAIVSDMAEELEAAVAGELYDCNGDPKVIPDMDEWKRAEYAKKVEEFRKEHPEDSYDPEEYGFDTYKEWMEDEIGTVDSIDEPEQMSLLDYIDSNSLGDLRFEVDDRLDLIGGKVLLAYGGPTVWVADDEVRGYWGGDQWSEPLNSDVRSELHEFFDEALTAAKERA